MTAFAQALRDAIAAAPKRLRRRALPILAILDANPSAEKDKQLAYMEEMVANHLLASNAIPGDSSFADWARFDWNLLIDMIIRLLLALLPFILAL